MTTPTVAATTACTCPALKHQAHFVFLTAYYSILRLMQLAIPHRESGKRGVASDLFVALSSFEPHWPARRGSNSDESHTHAPRTGVPLLLGLKNYMYVCVNPYLCVNFCVCALCLCVRVRLFWRKRRRKRRKKGGYVILLINIFGNKEVIVRSHGVEEESGS